MVGQSVGSGAEGLRFKPRLWLFSYAILGKLTHIIVPQFPQL